ncbi:RagB/SusD family nutrient uptake outer membrane protein [Pedobacter alpinus]|uniref:RagB/SusD family nutrient uptake outer membrane protein n=1 Tax=Pedobacter alpinus TaxID=1590643 RepID=A0ABW5TWN0_9SPHI
MMKLKLNTKKWLVVTAVTLAFTSNISCKKFLEVEPKDRLVQEQAYRNVFDADAAVYGVYGKFMDLASQYVILNELRADLMSVTVNSDPFLRQISNHDVTLDNPYASPKKYYEVILNCNDVLANFDIMLKDNKFTSDEYNQRYSDVACIRSWVYLQLGIHFGTIPYITDPLTDINDIKDVSKFPRVNFDQLLDILVPFVEGLPYKNTYASNSSLITTVDGYPTAKFFINKQCLIGDLNLWKGNYNRAATAYKAVMTSFENTGNDNDRYDLYKVRFADVATNNDIAVGYIRFREQDTRALINSTTQGWKSLFARQRDNLWNQEWIWALPFSRNFQPTNPFVDLFSIQGGKYLLKPSQQSIDNWNAQTQRNGIVGDVRKTFSINENFGRPVVMKYLYNYLDDITFLPRVLFEKEGNFFLYRAATLHLRFAEAANRDNRHRLANALLNDGIKYEFDPTPSNDRNRNVTNIQQTFDVPPYNFDARDGDFPSFRATWHRNVGLRNRAYVPRLAVVGDSTTNIESSLIAEAGLELAFEGNRWGDLMRIARRRNEPAFLADKVYQKLLKENNPNASAVRTKLMDQNNWYLPFKFD